MVIGKRGHVPEPCMHLILLKMHSRQRQLAKGLSKPCSICRARTPARSTLIEEAFNVCDRAVPNSINVRSVVASSEPVLFTHLLQ